MHVSAAEGRLPDLRIFDAVAEMTGLMPLVRELEARLAADVEPKDDHAWHHRRGGRPRE